MSDGAVFGMFDDPVLRRGIKLFMLRFLTSRSVPALHGSRGRELISSGTFSNHDLKGCESPP